MATLRDLMTGVFDAIYVATLVVRNMDSTTGLSFIQAKGRGDPNDATNQELVQEADLAHAQHFGFESYPPAGSELIVADAEGGEVAIAERNTLPSTLTADPLQSGESRTYGSDGQYILHESGGIIKLEPKSGQRILLGANASQFVAMANKVLTELQAIKTAYDLHVHTETGATTSVPTVPMTVPSSVAATKAMVE